MRWHTPHLFPPGSLMAFLTQRSWHGRFAAKPVLRAFPGWILRSAHSADINSWSRRMIWRLLRSPFEVERLEGLRLTRCPGNEISRSIFVTGRYRANEFCLLRPHPQTGRDFHRRGAQDWPVHAVRCMAPDRNRPALLELSHRTLNSQNAKSADVPLFLGDSGHPVYGFDPDSRSLLAVVPRSYLDSQDRIAIARGTLPW